MTPFLIPHMHVDRLFPRRMALHRLTRDFVNRNRKIRMVRAAFAGAVRSHHNSQTGHLQSITDETGVPPIEVPPRILYRWIITYSSRDRNQRARDLDQRGRDAHE